MTDNEENHCESKVEIVTDHLEKVPQIERILAICLGLGFIFACITAAIFAIIYAINYFDKPINQSYAPAPAADYRPY